MDEKTEELRELFVDVTDAETVTERQDEARGSLGDSPATREKLVDIVARMREGYEFTTSLTDDALANLVEDVYQGNSDEAIADELGVQPSEVFRARMDLHLICERDTDAPIDLDDLRGGLQQGQSVRDLADRFEVSESTVRKYRRVVDAQTDARRVSDRFRSEFEDAIADADLGDRLTSDVTDDGLEEATDGMETDVSF